MKGITKEKQLNSAARYSLVHVAFITSSAEIAGLQLLTLKIVQD